MLLFQCSAYKEGQVSGPLCSDLCEENNIHLRKCLSSVTEKKVYDGAWQGREVILKANERWFMEFNELQKKADNDLTSSFQNDVFSWVESMFGNCSQCSTLVEKLTSYADSNHNEIITACEARTFLSLMYQEESFMLMALNESKHSLDFYGYCGGLYVTEKVPLIAASVFGEKWEFSEFYILPDMFEPVEEISRTFGKKILEAAFSIPYTHSILNEALTLTKSLIFSTFSQEHIPSQKEKFDFLYSLLDATLSLSSNPYGLVQSCDIHLGNFGITSDSVVKFIDLDFTYPSVFLRTLLEQKQCATDEDCWVGTMEDCHSSCDIATNTCGSMVHKQDLLNICETHIPFVFRRSSILSELTGNSTSSLRKALGKLVMFCQTLPVAYSNEKLRHDILTVKEKLRIVEHNFSKMSVDKSDRSIEV